MVHGGSMSGGHYVAYVKKVLNANGDDVTSQTPTTGKYRPKISCLTLIQTDSQQTQIPSLRISKYPNADIHNKSFRKWCGKFCAASVVLFQRYSFQSSPGIRSVKSTSVYSLLQKEVLIFGF